jgi:acyl-CoA oxidase
VRLANDHIERCKRLGQTHEHAANSAGIELAAAADAHCRAFLVQSGSVMIEKHLKNVSPALGNVLRNIVELYAVDACIKATGDLLRVSGF